MKRNKQSKAKRNLLTSNKLFSFVKNLTNKAISARSLITSRSSIPTIPSLTGSRTRSKRGGSRRGGSRTGTGTRTRTRTRSRTRSRRQKGG